MFIDDIVLVAKGRFQAIVDDARLFGRDWGFRLADVAAPVRWWHGDADHIVPLRAAQAAVDLLPDAELVVRPGRATSAASPTRTRFSPSSGLTC